VSDAVYPSVDSVSRFLRFFKVGDSTKRTSKAQDFASDDARFGSVQHTAAKDG
jgi:hypothetical protein